MRGQALAAWVGFGARAAGDNDLEPFHRDKKPDWIVINAIFAIHSPAVNDFALD